MTEKVFTLRSLITGLIFGSLVAMANAFMLLTIPVMITAAMLSVAALFAYSTLFKAPPPSSKEAVIAYTVHQAAAFAFSIFPVVWVFIVAYGIPSAIKLRIPDWILPDPTLYGNVLQNGVIFSRSWITPLAWIIPVSIVSGVAALLVVIWLRDHLIEGENLTFPSAQADIEFIKSVSTEKFRMDYLFYGLMAGFFFDFLLIHYPTSMGVSPEWLDAISRRVQLVDFTPYLKSVLPGAAFCIILGLGLLGLGMLMRPRSSMNMTAGAVIFYVLMSALLVSRKTIEPFSSFQSQWAAFRYPYGLSLSIGLFLTAALAPIVLRLASPLITGARWKWKPPLSTLAAFAVFCVFVLMLFSILSADRFVSILPLTRGGALTAGLVVLVTFVVGILVYVRIAGETGTTWMSQFADALDFVRRGALTSLGAVGFEGFALSESLQGPRFAAGQIEALKVGKAFDVNPRHQYLGALLGWCFAWLVSTPFVLLLWHFYGIGRGALPMLNVEAIARMLTTFSAGRMEIVFERWSLLAGFIIGVILLFLEKRNLPFTVTAFAVGVFAGPLYVSTFFCGGLIRILIERVKGAAWMDEKGMPFAAGLVLGGLALAPLLTVLVNVLVLAIGGA